MTHRHRLCIEPVPVANDVRKRGDIHSCMRWCVAWLFCSAALAVGSAPLSPQPLVGRVVSVADGDTITVLDAQKRQHKIRLSGIDAPEGGQAFGNKSKQTLSDCAFGRQVSVEGDKLDRYGRTITRVVVDRVDCNLRQVELGMAWHYKKFASERPAAESQQYAAAEAVANATKRGLWSDLDAMPPWEWRGGGQQAEAAA